jgi:signal transduction histidine kinase
MTYTHDNPADNAGNGPPAARPMGRLSELEEIARRYRELKQAMADLMFVVDGAGRFLDVNEQFSRRLGYGPDELGGKRLYELVDGKAEDPRQRMMPFFARNGGQQVLDEGQSRSGAIEEAAQEMNQPLSGIYGYSELLKGSVGTRDPAYRYAKKIYEQSERLAALVKRIKAEQGLPPDGLAPGGQPSEPGEQEADR